jgi:hypothetical protein
LNPHLSKVNRIFLYLDEGLVKESAKIFIRAADLAVAGAEPILEEDGGKAIPTSSREKIMASAPGPWRVVIHQIQ